MLTRRAALTLGICAFMLFISLRYSSYVSHKTGKDKDKKKEAKKPPSGDGGQDPPVPGNPTIGADEPLGGELLTVQGGVSVA